MRYCSECGGEMREVASPLKGIGVRRTIHRFQCTECKLEIATTLTESEERDRVEMDRIKEMNDRGKIKY